MAHKGYTLSYFIDYFSSIPDHQWCTGDEQRPGTVQHCALGHASRNTKTTLENTSAAVYGRVEALENFLNDSVISINDARPGTKFYKLGKTPRGRILKALRNRKRTGKILES
jgi:hypothetical protein